MQGGNDCDDGGGDGGGGGGGRKGKRSKVVVAWCKWAEKELEMRVSLLGTACYMRWWLEQCELPLLNKRLVRRNVV